MTQRNKRDITQAKSPELRGSLAAMRRAGQMARDRAIQTNTNLIVMQDGQRVAIPPEQLRSEAQEPDPS